MVYLSDEIPLVFVLIKLICCLCTVCVKTSIQSKLSFPGTKPKLPMIIYRLDFNVTSIALNDVNVRVGYVIKTFTREIGTHQKIVSL